MRVWSGVFDAIMIFKILNILFNRRRVELRKRCYVYLLILCLSFFITIPQATAQDGALEFRVKAAFIYNFIAFTQWPNEIDQTIHLCIYGQDPFGIEVDKLERKPVHGRNIKVKRINEPGAIKNCQVIFFSTSAINEIAGIVNDIQNQPTLTLADNPQAIAQGVIINMSLAQEKVVFEINLGVARKSGLDLSSKLLQLAIKVNH